MAQTVQIDAGPKVTAADTQMYQCWKDVGGCAG